MSRLLTLLRQKGGFSLVEATGGAAQDVLYDGVEYRVHKFTLDGDFTVAAGGTVEYLVLAGGGGGGSFRAGGGGAGGLLTGAVRVTPGVHAVTVGTGGKGGAGGVTAINTNLSENGGDSAFGALVQATGGGRGAHSPSAHDVAIHAAASGGSGGGGRYGAWRSISPFDDYEGKPGVENQGHAGGTSNAGISVAGGGGGASAAAATPSATQAGNGGDGFALVDLGWGGLTGVPAAVGGGGGGAGDPAANKGAGGLGGGTSGGYLGDIIVNSPANTGGGGGGSAQGNRAGGNGGSGLVLIRYPLDLAPPPAPEAAGLDFSLAGGSGFNAVI